MIYHHCLNGHDCGHVISSMKIFGGETIHIDNWLIKKMSNEHAAVPR